MKCKDTVFLFNIYEFIGLSSLQRYLGTYIEGTPLLMGFKDAWLFVVCSALLKVTKVI